MSSSIDPPREPLKKGLQDHRNRLVPWPHRFPPIPASLTPLIGREQEITEACDLFLRRGSRLVTLFGPGGIGKTRLAQAVGMALEPSFLNGVAWISLAAVNDPDLVLPSIMSALGVRDAPGRPPIEALHAAVDGLRLLLVIDNFEQIAAAAPVLTDVLRSLPQMAMLVTSRSVLRVQGEQVVPVRPLTLPAPDAPATPSEAVQLFVERARAAVPNLPMGPEELQAVSDICRRLDGLPLAIELAAARVTHISIETLRGMMDHRLPVLTIGANDLPPRQRTMREAIAWSYDLLPKGEQLLFRRLSVFNGGFRFDALDAVNRDLAQSESTDHPSELLNELGSLVDQSLVQHQSGAGGSRFSLLETIREFAGERMRSSGEDRAVQTAHAGWALGLAEELGSLPFTIFDPTDMQRLHAEDANLQSALSWLDHNLEVRSLVRMASALGWYWWIRGLWGDGVRWLERAWERSRTDLDTVYWPLPLSLAMMLAAREQSLHQAEAIASQALDLSLAGEDAYGTASSQLILGWMASLKGDDLTAMDRLEQGLTHARNVGDPALRSSIMATMLSNLANECRIAGRLQEARAYLEEASALYAGERIPRAEFQLMRDLGLGLVARDLGELHVARRLLRSSLQAAFETEQPRQVVAALDALATFHAAAGEPERAARMLGKARQLRLRLGMVEESPRAQAARETAEQAARTALGDDAYDTALSAGFDMTLEEAIAQESDESATEPAESASIVLTPREREILPLLAAGLSDRAIGEALFIGDRTVESHVGRIYAKLGVRSRAAAVARAVSLGLINPAAIQTEEP